MNETKVYFSLGRRTSLVVVVLPDMMSSVMGKVNVTTYLAKVFPFSLFHIKLSKCKNLFVNCIFFFLNSGLSINLI